MKMVVSNRNLLFQGAPIFRCKLLVSGMVVIDVNSIIDSWGLDPLLMFCFESMDALGTDGSLLYFFALFSGP